VAARPAAAGLTVAAEDDRLERAHADGVAAARRGEEAAPGCTVTPEGRAWLRGYVEGAKMRPCDAPTSPPSK
jgi:hypothetical protein